MHRIPHIFSALLLFAALFMPLSAQAEYYTEMPVHLRMTQKTSIEQLKKNIYLRLTYPQTANEEVNSEMAALIDEMTARSRDTLSLERTDATSSLDVGAVISRTGTSFMSFLTIAETSREYVQHHVDFDARVYDIRTGKRIFLTDVFPEGSGAWSVLADAARTQLSAAFPSMEADSAALDALCSEAAIKEAAFTMGPVRLTLTYRADALYPGKNTLLHVNIPYGELRRFMTPVAYAQTDNSRFRMVALTYDDGPVRDTTRKVMDELRKGGASATFFIIGRRMPGNRDFLARQQDSNYSIQSHTYTHRYPGKIKTDEIFAEKAQFAAELAEITGVAPVMMRAPGGMDEFYTEREIGYPVMHWSLAAGDSGNGKTKSIVPRVLNQIDHGDIVLMHDLNSESPRYTAKILASLNEQGYLCVTVEELFIAAGVPLENNRVYFSPYRADE